MRSHLPVACLSLLLLLAASPLVADEPASAPPQPIPGTSSTAARRVDPPGLPPPVVRRSGERTALPPAAPMGGVQAPLPATQPSSAQPASAQPPVMEFPTGPAAAPPATMPDVGVALPALPASGPAILDIVKNHNLPAQDGRLYLRLDVRFRADGPAGSAYRVWMHFHDNATGQAVRTAMPSFGDLQGTMFVVTKPVQHAGGSVEYVAPLWLPYAAFPDPGPGRNIVVDATASLTLATGETETPLHSSATNFLVHGTDAAAAAAR